MWSEGGHCVGDDKELTVQFNGKATHLESEVEASSAGWLACGTRHRFWRCLIGWAANHRAKFPVGRRARSFLTLGLTSSYSLPTYLHTSIDINLRPPVADFPIVVH